jgi:uncharacterized repeat protein (TIGR01451 family)
MFAFSARRSNGLLAWLLVLAAGCPSAFAGKEFLAGPHDQVQPDQLLVGLKPGADISQVLSAIVPQAVASALGHNRNVYLLNLPPGIQAAVSKLLAAHPLVAYVEPNHIRNVTVRPPNDTYLTEQWNLTTVHAQQAWNYLPDLFLTSATAGTNRVKVAILDTGLDCTHPDFINAGGTSTDSAQGGQIDWADSTYIQKTTLTSPTCNGWADDYGHGTHVAGILAAATNNATGVASLGFPLQIIMIKTSSNTGEATDYQVAQGMLDALDAGAQVISMSLGGEGYSQTMQNAMDAAWANNVLVVAAAGNEGTSELIYPGDGNHVLAVAATDDTNTVASFSSYGNWVRIAAPGVGILSTLPTYANSFNTENYGTLEGTSMATPHVSALAGLLFAANPGISAAEVAQRIQQTAQSPHTGWNQNIGYGVINAAAALANIPGPFTEGALTGQVVDSNGFPLSGAVVTAGTQQYTTADDPISGVTDGLFRINLSPGTYPVTVTDTGNNTVTTQATVVAGADTMLTIQFGISYGSFTGTVTYNGVGVAGAAVVAISDSQIVGTAITNSSGNYTLSVQPGSYTLTAAAPNYIDTTSGSQTLAANGTVTVNLALSALGNITGTITDLNGLPVPNANVAFTSANFSGGAITGSNGTYTTMSLPEGTYTVTASAPGYTNVSVSNVTVANNISTPVNLNFSTGVALSTGLLAYWPFNDGSGTQALDQSGNGHNANLTNTTWTTGLLFPFALQFNVNESYAVSNAIPFSAAFSASVWVNSAASEIGWSSLVYASTWSLGLDSTGTMYKFIINGGTGSTGTCSIYNISQGCAQGGTVATGWHLVIATYDGTNALLYVDGALVASDTFTVTLGSTTLQMGVNWGGAMQSMRIYGRVLTAPEVIALYSQGSPAALSLSKTADAATAAAGSSIGFTLMASNPGTGTAQVVTLNDPLPAGTGINWSISPAYSGPGSCGIANGTLSCSFGSLSSGATASVHVASTTTVSGCGVYANTATASSTNASSAQASATTTVQCGQTISFAALSNQPYGTAPFTVSATASSGLAVSFNSQTTLSVCTVSGSTVTLVTSGTCTIQATQAGNAIYAAATPVNQSFTVTAESQTIAFGGLSNHAFGSGTFNVSATASSGLSVSFNSQTTLSVCTVSGSTVTLVAAGTCTVQATQAGNSDWAAATPVNQSFQVTQGSQTITFGPLSNEPHGTAPFTVSATASSGLSVSFNSQTTLSVCTVSGSTVTLVAAGTCTVQATQAGNSDWAAATPVNQSFQVTQGSQSISFSPLQNQAFGTAPFAVSATASSGQPVSFNSQTTTGVCTVSGSTVTLVNVGTCTVQATQAGSSDWAAATPVNQSFQVTQGSQTISFSPLQNQAFGTSLFAVSATASSGQPVSFNSQTTTGVCTVSGSTVTLVAVGTCTIQATQSGTANWSAATPVNQSFQVTQGSQTISFSPLQNQAFGTSPFTVSATASSGQPVSFNSQTTTGVCTASGSTVTLVAVGTCTIQATQAGNANWAAATPVNQSFQVTQGSQTISFSPLQNQAFGTSPFAVSATASSGQPVSFNSQTTTNVCTVSGSTVTLVYVGTCTIQATQSGTANWAAATPVNQSFQVTQGSQTISFSPLQNQAFGTSPFIVSATASSGQPVSFNSQTTTGVCTVSGSTVTLVAAGTCTIQATQSGTANWAAATPVNQSFQVTQGSQTINFGPLQNQAFGTSPFAVSATASSGQPVSFNSQTTTNVCTVSGSTVTLVAVGTCTIQATQAGNANWAAATPVNQSFQVTQGSQTISFSPLQNQAFGTSPFAVSATASSGQPVSFNSQTTTGVCTASGSTVTLVAVGTCTIQATQSGNANWSAATPVNQSFQVTQGSQTITFPTIPTQALGTAPFALTATASSGLTVSFSSQTMLVCTVSNGTVTLGAIGTCTIQATQAGNSNYSPAPSASQSFTVTAGIGTLGVNSLNFPNTIVGNTTAAQTFNFQNSGNTPLAITSIAPAGPDAANYHYAADASHPCPISPATLAVSASCTLDVTFAPVSQGAHNNAQIAIIDNSGNVPGTTQSIGLTGTGIVLASISVSANTASLTYGASEPFTATGTYSDNSTAGLTSQVTWASSAQNIASVNASGLATALAAGQTNITASLSGITSNNFQLTVVAGTPASISAAAGSGQSATVGTAFASAFEALVKDGGGDPVPNASVTFTAPGNGASGTFSNGLASYTASTNSSGIATSLLFTANSNTGAYSVTASVAGVASQSSFSLTNVKAPVLTVTESANGAFMQGQSASYTITVANAANAGPTSGAITVTESVPAGLTLTGLNGGAAWTCSVPSATCTSNAMLNPGSTSTIAVTVMVGYNAQGTASNGVGVTGGASQPFTASDPTIIISACAVTQDSTVSVADLQQIVNEALGVVSPANDLNGDGVVNIVDLQIVTNAVLGGACKAS